MEVLVRDRVVGSKGVHHVAAEGSTIDEILASVSWNRALDAYTRITIEGVEIDSRHWSRVRPNAGKRVVVGLVPRGGGGGSQKSTLAAVASIAIMVVALIAAPAIAGVLFPALEGAMLTAVTAGIAAGIGVAGSLAIGALIKPPSLANRAITSNPDSGNAPSEGSLYGVSGGANALARYGVVPKLFGRARITPNQAAEPYVISAGPVQILRMILDFGYGPLMIDDLRVGTTPLSSFPTARYRLHPAFVKGDPLYIYTTDNATLSVSASLIQDSTVDRRVAQPSRVIHVDIGFPAGLVEISDQGAFLNKTETLHLTVFNDIGQTYYVNHVPHWALFGGDEGANVSGEQQIGSQSPAFARQSTNSITWSIFSGQPAPAVNQVIRWGSYEGIIQELSDYNSNPVPGTTFDVPTLWVRLSTPLPADLNYYDDVSWYPRQDQMQAVLIQKGYAASVGPITVGFGPYDFDVVFTGRSRAPRTVSVVMEMPMVDSWTVRVRRVSPSSASPQISNAMTWVSLRGERSNPPIAPDRPRTIMELEVSATEQVNGQIQNINALVTSMYYDWRTNDGRRSVNRSPAFAYVDLLTSPANKRAIPYSLIDMAKMTAWHDWCSANSAQGDMQATCDLLVESRSTVAEIAQTICAAGRAVPAIIDGKYSVIMEDEVRTPIQMFTERNTKSMSTSRVWADEPHVLVVRYLSETDWERTELRVYADGYDEFTATRSEVLDLVGTTRPSQAWRMGRYYLAQARLRKETMEVETDIENLVCQRGDLVRAAHLQLLNGRTARVTDVQGDTLHLDADFDLIEMSIVREFDFRPGVLPSGSVFTRAGPATAWNPATLTWDYVLADKPIFTDEGLLTEPQLFNHVPNPRMVGAAPGVWPTGWSPVIRDFNGMTLTLVGRGVESGIDYIEIEFDGTQGGAVSALFALLPNAFAPAVPGNRYQNAMFVSVVSGSPSANWGTAVQLVTEMNNGTSSTVWASQPIQPDDRPLFQQRWFQNATVTEASTTRIRGYPQIVFPVGSVCTRLRVRIGWPATYVNTLGRTISAQNPIVPAPGVILATLRNSDQIRWALTTLGVAPTDRMKFNVKFKRLEDQLNGRSVYPVILDAGNTSNYVGILENGVGTDIVGYVRNAGADRWIALAASVPGPDYEVTMDLDGKGDATMTVAGFTPVVVNNVPLAPWTTVRAMTADNILAQSQHGILKVLTVTTQAVNQTDRAIQLRTADGQILPPSLILGVPASDQLIVDSALAALASPGDVIALGTLTTTATDWLVESISPGPDMTASLKLIEYAPAINDADTGPLPPYVPPNSIQGGARTLDPVRSLVLLRGVGYVDVFSVASIKVDWDPPNGYSVSLYIVERQFGNGVLQIVARSDETFFSETIPHSSIPAGGISVVYYVTPVSTRGLRGETAEVSGILYSDTIPPSAPAFTSNSLGEVTRLVWTRPPEPDTAGYQIRWTPDYTTTDWNKMQILQETVSANTTTMTVHTRSGLYAIRARDTAGNYSEVAYTRTQVSALMPVDKTYTVQGPPWTGTFSNVTINPSGHLILTKDPNGLYYRTGYFQFSAPLTLVQAWRLRVQTEMTMNVFPVDGVINAHDAQIWISAQSGLPKLNSAWFTPLANAAPLAGGPTAVTEWTPVITEWMEGLLFNVRVVLTSRDGVHSPVVSAALADFFFDPRIESQSDVNVPTGILSVTYRYPFVQKPSLLVTLDNGDKDDWFAITVNTATGFTIEIRSGNGQLIPNRSIDWVSTGIGIGI